MSNRTERLSDSWLDPNGSYCYFRNWYGMDQMMSMVYEAQQPRRISIGEFRKYRELELWKPGEFELLLQGKVIYKGKMYDIFRDKLTARDLEKIYS